MCPVFIRWKRRHKKSSLSNLRLLGDGHSLARQKNINFASGSQQAANQTVLLAQNEMVLDPHQVAGLSDQALLEKLAKKWDICKRNSKNTLAINVSELCSAVLQSIAKARAHQDILRDFLQRGCEIREPGIYNLETIELFVEAENPFAGKMSENFQRVLRKYDDINERLQSQRNVRRTSRFAMRLLRISIVFLVAGAVSLVVASLGGALMLVTAILAGPLAIAIPVKALALYRTVVRPLKRKRRQQNVVSLIAFVVKHSLQTMDFLIAHLRDEVENIRKQLRFFLEHNDYMIRQHICEQLQRNQETFSLLLNDLEARSILSEWT